MSGLGPIDLRNTISCHATSDWLPNTIFKRCVDVVEKSHVTAARRVTPQSSYPGLLFGTIHFTFDLLR
jgi:hypothetical protein